MDAESSLNTPVSFFIFNRPELTRKVFEQIRNVRPKTLFVLADGPREGHPTDAEKCQATRAIIEEIDWKCEVIKNFSEVNLGCCKRVSSGLTWIFDRVEEAIVLEDDCVPHQTFFRYCEELLAGYRHDTRIGMISGSNLLPVTPHGDWSYFFSICPFVWGWAGWRRSWTKVDLEMTHWNDFCANGLSSVFPDRRMRNYWQRIFQGIADGTVKDSWDHQLSLAFFMNSMLSIVPNVNLVTNIGFSADSTHCSNPFGPGANIPGRQMEFPLRHPPYMVPDSHAWELIFKSTYEEGMVKTAIAKALLSASPGLHAHIKTVYRHIIRPRLGRSSRAVHQAGGVRTSGSK